MSPRRWPFLGGRRARAGLTLVATAGLLAGAGTPAWAAPGDSGCKGPDEWPSNRDRLAREIATACNALIIDGSAERNQLSHAYNLLSICLEILGLNKGVLNLQSKAIEQKPDSATFYANRAKLYLNADSLELALADAKTAMDLNGTLVRPLIFAGVIKSRSGDDGAALSYFQRAIATNKDHPLVYLEIGRFYVNIGKPRQALDNFARAEDLTKKRSFGQEGREWTLDYKIRAIAGRCRTLALLAEPSAGRVCDQALGESSASVDAHFGKGLILVAKGDDETALTHFNVAIKGDPYFSEAIVARGKVYERKGDLTRARQEYERAIERQPARASGYLARARLLETQGQTDEAKQALMKALEVQPSLSDAHSAMAAFYERRNETVEAVASYKRALALNPDNQDAKSALAKLRIQRAP